MMNHQLQYHPTSLFLLLQRVELLLVQYHPLIAVRHPWLLVPWSKQFKALTQTMTATSPTATTENREIVNPNLQSPKTFWEKKPACVTKNTNTFWKELYTSRNDMKMECKPIFFPYGDNRHTPERRSSSSIGSSEENLCYDACDSTQYQRWVRRS
jgi:hypothetical protein